jgi:glycerol-3-phosphate O-acyltransferase / dihydroxyacetone phosphate acyltransferase
MPDSRTLRLSEMLFQQKGSPLRRLVHAAISLALRFFFRRIETSGAERVPVSGPLIFVLNHPNGLIDPGLVFCALPRRVSFLAKSTLFKMPGVAFLLRVVEALPLYRRVDAGEDLSRNRLTFAACHALLREGRCIALFPEGVSHSAPRLLPVKTGAARIALGALGIQNSKFKIQNSPEIKEREPETENRFDLKIMAVGLYYTSKTAFRSEALIRYGEIFEVEPVELDENGEPPRAAVQALTDRIEAALRRVTLNLESAEELDAALKAEALFSSVYQNLLFRQTLAQSFQRLQNLAEKYRLLGENEPEKMRELNEKITRYENELKSSGLTSESLSVLQHPTRYVFRYLVLRVVVLLALAPLAIAGAIVHSPAFVFSNLVGQMFRTHGADAAGSTYKILAAIVLMPLTWLIVGLVGWWFFGWQAALVSIPAAILCGYVALRSSETLVDLSVWLRAAWLLFRRRALFLRLLLRRETLQREIGEIIEK